MTVLRQNLTITGTYTLTDTLEVASGVTITVMPGAVLNLGGNTLTNYGSLILQGSASQAARVESGSYSTDSTTGSLVSSYGVLDHLAVDGFFSNGSLRLSNTVVQNSSIDALAANAISESLFINSPFDLGTETGQIERTTFLDSPIRRLAWPSMFGEGQVTLNQCNFVGDGVLINLDPFFSGGGHNIRVTRSYIDLGTATSVEDFIYDADDTLRVQTDIGSDSFSSTPYTNSASGFVVGTTLLSLSDLGIGRVSPSVSINGGLGNDFIISTVSNEYINGGEGIDTVIFSGQLTQYQISVPTSGVRQITSSREGADTLANVERIQFSDQNLALDTGKGGIAGSAYRIYKAAFDRVPDTGGLGFWINALDDGASLNGVARGFISSPEFKALYGSNASDRDFVTKLYNNVLDRNPDQGGYDFWLGAMANGLSREDVLINFSESNENIANVADLIANGIQYQEWSV